MEMSFSSFISSSMHKSVYSKPFNMMTYFGAWQIKTESPIKKKLFLIYQYLMLACIATAAYFFYQDLITVFGDMKKMSWNLCVNSLFLGSIVKLLILYRKKNELNTLRIRLHEDMERRRSPEDLAIHRKTQARLTFLRRSIYFIIVAFCIVWIVNRYQERGKKSKLLVIPVYIPADLDDGFNFDLAFGILVVLGLVGIVFLAELELAVFGVLLQLTREYENLLSDLPKLNQVYERERERLANCLDGSGGRRRGEQDPRMNMPETKALLKQICIRQQTLIDYTQMFELCFNRPMVLHIVVGCLLAVAIGLQCILLSTEDLPELSYQMAYLMVVLGDLFLVCLVATRLNAQCLAVGEELYGITWYGLDLKAQRDISLMIFRSQRPPRLTTAKAVELNLMAFNSILKHVYSWLALFRQLTFK